MKESIDSTVNFESFLEYMKSIAWCKQGDDTLVAVHKCTPEIIEIMKDRAVKIFPGGMQVRASKSWLTSMQEKFEEGLAVPLLLVWKPAGLELWYRRHKSWEFPYDAWADATAAAYEKEQVLLSQTEFGERLNGCYKEILSRASACPSAIPKQ